MKNQIKEFCEKLGIEYVGFTKEDGKTAIVCLFPYYTGKNENANISVYTYSYDYHIVINKYLTKIADFLKDNFSVEIYGLYSDISPYDDIKLAVNAGLGIKGRNNLLINEKYGTFVFIGYIMTDAQLEFDIPLNKNCLMCGNCINKCPSGCLKDNDYSICLSHLTQKKTDLAQFEEKLIHDNKLVFGCDVCQFSCPMNTFEVTPLKEFKEDPIYVLNKDMFLNLSNKEFKDKYSKRAFSWRGKKVLLRNLDIISRE